MRSARYCADTAAAAAPVDRQAMVRLEPMYLRIHSCELGKHEAYEVHGAWPADHHRQFGMREQEPLFRVQTEPRKVHTNG